MAEFYRYVLPKIQSIFSVEDAPRSRFIKVFAFHYQQSFSYWIIMMNRFIVTWQLKLMAKTQKLRKLMTYRNF